MMTTMTVTKQLVTCNRKRVPPNKENSLICAISTVVYVYIVTSTVCLPAE